MSKYILLSLAVLFLATTHCFAFLRDDNNATAQFLKGLNDKLSIGNGTDVDPCTDGSLIEHIKDLLDEVDSTIPNPYTIFEDVKAMYDDYSQMEASCPQLAAVYEQFFSNFNQNFDENPFDTFTAVMGNIKDNFDSFSGNIESFSNNIETQNYYNAGGDFGSVIGITLKGYIN